MLVFSDLHLDESNGDVILGEVLPGILEAARRLGDPEIACLGDFWNLRYKIDVGLQNAVRDALLGWMRAGTRFYFLPGNHDQVDVLGRNALEVFDGLGMQCQVFTQPTWTPKGLWVPYRKYQRDLVTAFELPAPSGYAPVLWGHFELRNAWMNNQMRDSTGLELSTLSKFETVILGHYHKRQRLEHAYYVGSPWQVTSNEAGQEKGFAVWDGAKLKFVTTQWGRRHHKIRLEPGESLDTSQFHPGDDVRVSTAVGLDPSAVGAELAALGIAHTITPDVVGAEQRLDVASDASFREYAQEYVRQIPTTLDQGRLMDVFGELTP